MLIDIKRIGEPSQQVKLLDMKLFFRPPGEGALDQFVTIHISSGLLRHEGKVGQVFYDNHLYTPANFSFPNLEDTIGKSIEYKIELANTGREWDFLTDPRNGFQQGTVRISILHFNYGSGVTYHEDGNHPETDTSLVSEANRNAVRGDFPPLWYIKRVTLRPMVWEVFINRIKEINNVKCVLECTTILKSKHELPPSTLQPFCQHEFKSPMCGYAGEDTECTKTLVDCLNKGNGCRYVGSKRAR